MGVNYRTDLLTAADSGVLLHLAGGTLLARQVFAGLTPDNRHGPGVEPVVWNGGGRDREPHVVPKVDREECHVKGDVVTLLTAEERENRAGGPAR